MDRGQPDSWSASPHIARLRQEREADSFSRLMNIGVNPLPALYLVSLSPLFAAFGSIYPLPSFSVRPIAFPCSTCLTHGAPHLAQHLSGHPANMHGSTSAGGNVAKCASLNGAVGISHTVRRLRHWLLTSLMAPLKDEFCLHHFPAQHISGLHHYHENARCPSHLPNRLRIVIIPLALGSAEIDTHAPLSAGRSRSPAWDLALTR